MKTCGTPWTLLEMFQDLPAIKAAIMYTNRVQTETSHMLGELGKEILSGSKPEILVLLF